jgi:hypothetical protein
VYAAIGVTFASLCRITGRRSKLKYGIFHAVVVLDYKNVGYMNERKDFQLVVSANGASTSM